MMTRTLAAATAVLGIAAFWVGMAIAAALYRPDYDWRYLPVSNLVSFTRNPAGCVWGSIGIVVCGLCAFLWATLLTTIRRGTRAALQLGGFCLAATAIPGAWVGEVRKAHELCALLAFGGLCVGMVCLMAQLIGARYAGHRAGRARRWTAGLTLVATAPVAAAGIAQAYVFYALPHLHWVNARWRSEGVPVYLSFAFWEWITVIVVSAYLLCLAIATSFAWPAPTRTCPPGALSAPDGQV